MKRFLLYFIALVSVFCICVFPVSASDYRSFSFNLDDFTDGAGSYMITSSGQYDLAIYRFDQNTAAYNTPSVSINGDAVLTFFWHSVDLTLSAGDMLRWDGFFITRIGGNNNTIKDIRFDFGTDDASSTGNDIVFERYGVNIPGGEYRTLPLNFSATATRDLHITRIRMQVRINFPSTGGGQFSYQISAQNNTISIGNPQSPDFPSYSSPDGDGTISDADRLDSAVLDGASGGLNDAGTLFSGFGSLIGGLRQGMMFVSGVMGSIFSKIVDMSTLGTISLSLGIFAFLVGIVATVVRRSNRSGKG